MFIRLLTYFTCCWEDSFGVKYISKAYVSCLWVLLTHVYWFKATGGYICGQLSYLVLLAIFRFDKIVKYMCILPYITNIHTFHFFLYTFYTHRIYKLMFTYDDVLYEDRYSLWYVAVGIWYSPRTKTIAFTAKQHSVSHKSTKLNISISNGPIAFKLYTEVKNPMLHNKNCEWLD